MLFWVWGETWPGHVLDRLHEIHPERSPAIWHQWQLSQHFINFHCTHPFVALSLTDQTFITITLTSICGTSRSRSLWSYQNHLKDVTFSLDSAAHTQLFKFHKGYWFWIYCRLFCLDITGKILSSLFIARLFWRATLSIESKWMNADQGLSTSKKNIAVVHTVRFVIIGILPALCM